MKNRRNKKTIVAENSQMRVFMHPFANPKERKEFLMNLAISSEFEMRHRGLFEYYGKDLIAYKQEKPSDTQRNEFLRILSKFMTTRLEDNCPPSWKDCQPSFWEELIFTFYPHNLDVSKDQKEVESFLFQLRKFVRWLDKRVGTSWYSVIKTYTDEASPDLNICEKLFNAFMLRDYPRMHHKDWDPFQDLEKTNQSFNLCTEKVSSVFEVTSMIEDNIIVTDFDTKRTFYLKDFSSNLFMPGLIINGLIGKKEKQLTWHLLLADAFCPQRGKKYITIKKEHPLQV
ncbi:hypothetical protein KW850_21685 [Bacillus sp. sid0103]|uniref:hypothetical protein n=1 Tax=Bacillus sp. sid0103 TaxID=2856337 RepID=UPI001C47B7D3|nr:hypothetical protein [Bacillus sp. sid0103]MBV7507845.1 hypothetical protein [Bacillus sp. sid0103]